MIDTKYYEDLAARRNPDFVYLDRALNIVKKFIIDKRLIIYGGMSIDLSLKAVRGEKNGIYGENTIPDYDFFSPDPFSDSIELADILHREGFDDVSAINAMHITTRRVRVNFTVVADISYMPKNIFDKVPRVSYRGLDVVHPHFQFIDMHREFILPIENPPIETFFFRTKKSISRYKLISEAYPINIDLDKLEVEDREISAPYSGALIGGISAYAMFYELYIKLGGKAQCIPAKIKIDKEVYLKTYYLSPKINYMQDVIPVNDKTLRRFMDNLRPRCTIIDNCEYYETKYRKYACVDIDGIKCISAQGVLLYASQQAFEKDPKYLAYYVSMRNIIADVEKMYIDSPKDEYKKFFLSSEFYGEENKSDVYIDFVEDTRSVIEKREKKVSRPPRGYFRNIGDTEVQKQTFDLKNEYFSGDGLPEST